MITIVKIGKALDGWEEAAETHWKKIRLDDMVANGGKRLSDSPEDIALEKEAQKLLAERAERRKKWESYRAESREKFLETFGSIVDRETAKYGMPKDVLLRLIEKESSFNPKARPLDKDGNSASTAYGLGQQLNGTWQHVAQTLLPGEDLDRENPEDQIKATAAYLNEVRAQKGCDWQTAVVYYHTGPGFNDSHLEAAKRANPGIAKRMDGNSAESYVAAAQEYYFA